jgi:hypothetical protein
LIPPATLCDSPGATARTFATFDEQKVQMLQFWRTWAGADVRAVTGRRPPRNCGAHGCRGRKAIAAPAANATKDSNAMTGTGGHGFAPPPIGIAGAACGASPMVA